MQTHRPSFSFLFKRVSISTLAIFANVSLALHASGDEVAMGIDSNIITESGGVPVSAKTIQTGQNPALQQAAVILGYTQKYGTALNDSLTGITTDTLGNVYIAGNSHDWISNGFLRKYSSLGVLLWEKTRSTTSIDGVTLDKNGNAYIVGSYGTGSGLSARNHIYLEKYDSDGNLQWTKSFAAAPATDPTMMIANGIVTDPTGNNFIVILFERAYWPYQTRDLSMRKYSVTGRAIWEKPVGISSPYTTRPVLTIDKNGKLYTAINSASNQRWNMTVGHFDAQGDALWSNVFYPSASLYETYIHGITSDPDGNLYVAGITKADLEGKNLGGFDAFIRKYDITGNTLWTRQYGTSANDYANSLTTDSLGNLFVAGSTSGVIQGKNLGSFDALIHKFTGNGDVLQTRQFGTVDFDMANNVRLDSAGSLYVAGHTLGRLGGAKKGGQDVYFRKYTSFQ